MYTYSKDEQETIISFNELETEASVYTFNRRLINLLARLAGERPAECRLYRKLDSSCEYMVPKSWIRVRPPREASEAQREAARAALQKVRSSAPARGK